MDLIVGDIHGCWEEFQDLLSRAGLGSRDRVIAVGDIVDRGPDSERVLDWFRARPAARCVLGNHERKHLRAAEGRVEPALSQRIVRRQLGDRYPELLDFCRDLPISLTLEEATVVHAFFEPGVPLEEQRDNVLCGTLSGEHYLSRKYDRPWYELYDGPPIVVGHRNYRRDGAPFVYKDRVFGIDTQCYAGGRLTGLLLPAFAFVSVPARRDHWAWTREQYEELDEE